MQNPCTILLIDDNPDDIFITRRAIAKCHADCVVESASTGQEAIDRLLSGKIPALIFLDLKMPGIGGIEVLQFIRSQEPLRYIPVVILTSSRINDDLKTAYKAGANSFIHKCHDLQSFTRNLSTAIQYWIELNISPE